MAGNSPDFSGDPSLSELFTANERLSTLLTRFLSTQQFTFEEGHLAPIQAVTSVALGKAVKTHRAILILCRIGYGEDAFILLRTLFELALDVRYCARDETDEAAQRWIDYEVVQRHHYHKLVSNDPYFEDYRQEHPPSDESAEEFAQEMERVQERWRFWGKNTDGKLGYPVAHWSGKNRRQLAVKVGWTSHYDSLYRLASEVSHTSIKSADSYLTIDEDAILRFKIGPSDNRLSNVLLSGHIYVGTIAANWVKVMCPQSSLRSELDQARQDFIAMIERRLGPDKVARARRAGTAQGDIGD